MKPGQQGPGFWHFTREFLRDPRGIGAVFPSSPFLARHMASLVPSGPGTVVELGPGLGPVTRALLESGIKPEDLVLIERAEPMVHHLHQHFPGIEIIHGDAARLTRLLAARLPVRAIVSSLPLRSIPRPAVQDILKEIAGCSSPGTAYIQFTYHPSSACRDLPESFVPNRVRFIWRNLPPARVDRYIYQSRPITTAKT